MISSGISAKKRAGFAQKHVKRALWVFKQVFRKRSEQYGFIFHVILTLCSFNLCRCVKFNYAIFVSVRLVILCFLNTILNINSQAFRKSRCDSNFALHLINDSDNNHVQTLFLYASDCANTFQLLSIFVSIYIISVHTLAYGMRSFSV